MNTVKKLLSLLLALCLCLSLCACTKAPAQDEEEEDLAGADWRTWGLIADYGTITQDGASIDLALTVEADQAVLYLDQSDMVTFAELRYPVAIDGAADCYSSIEFVDLDEDGYDDIRLLFDSETDGAILLTYFWDGEDYVFDYDYSKLPGQSEDDEAEVTPEPAVESDAMYAVQLDQPFFEAAGLSVNALMDDGTYYLQNGAASFTDGYTRYYRSDAQWEVRKDSETDLGDGTRQIEFTAICYIPDADIPNYSGEYYSSCSMEIFDYYTGLWLADAQVYGDTTHGDNTYYYSIEYNGTPYDVLYSYSTDWMQQVGDYSAILMVNYQVVIPNGYDGLIFAGVPTAVDGEARDERGYAVDHYALQNILEAPDFEPYNALFFNINCFCGGKTMCKRILALLLALMLCASLSACGGKQEEEAQPGGHELDEYFGWWQYDDYTSVIAFADGNAWSIYAGDGSLSYTGLFEFDGSGIRALDEQGETAHYFLLDETGTLLTDDDGDTLRPTQAPSAAESPLDEEDVTLADYVGVWEYDTAYAWLAIDGDGNWMTVDGNGEIAETGTVEEANADGLSLYLPSEEGYWTFTRISATEISEDSSGESLFAVDEIALPGVETTDGEPAFEAAGLTDFCPVDGGSYLLRDGLACFPEDESWYETGDVYWEVALHNDFVHDGIRELEFTAICYIPQESLPDDGGKGYYNTLFCELYDYDSGMWLTSVSATGDSGRDENHFLHTIDWNGSEETIEFFFSNEWGDEGDWGRVLYRSYIAYVPEDYDGLVVGAAAAPLDTDELHVRNQLFETSPYCTVSQMDSIDPYTSLYFRLS